MSTVDGWNTTPQAYEPKTGREVKEDGTLFDVPGWRESLNGKFQNDSEGSIKVALGDGPQLDAFNRLRVSNPGNRLDVEFIYDKQPDFFDELTNSGTVTHNANARDLTLSIANATNGTYAWMRSIPTPYTPGCSQQIDITGVLDLTALGTGTAEVFLRSTVSGTTTDLTTIKQASWTSNATGIDWSKSQIFAMDFQSLKVGRIRFGLVKAGVFQTVATIENDNLYDTGYWQSPSLPVSYRLYNAGGNTYAECCYGDDLNAIGFRYVLTANASATMRAICCTVKSEGGPSMSDIEGLPRSIDSGNTPVTVSTTLIPLLSLRPRSTFNSLNNLLVALPKALTIQTDNPVRFVVYHEGTLTGASWANVNTLGSMMEYDTSATAITGGNIVATDYVATSKNQPASAGTGLLGKTVMWHRRGAETGILTLCAVRTTTTNASVLVGVNWEEIR